MSNKGEQTTVIEPVTIKADGSIAARVWLYTGQKEPKEVIEFIMEPLCGGISQPIFLYSLSSAQLVD